MQEKSLEFENSGNLEDLSRQNDRLRGDLFTIARRLSHDLRTPLGGIISAGEALKEILVDTAPSLTPMAVSVLESAEELSQLIKRASFVLKATALPLPAEPMNMGESVSAGVQRLERRFLQQGATLIRPDDWPQINGVSSWMEVIWWNLVANALQHAHATALQVEVGWTIANGAHRFLVSDNGQGVAPARQRQLFQPFDKLHEPGAGPGLGLSIVHRLVELQGGRCGYEGKREGGACFFFELPANYL